MVPQTVEMTQDEITEMERQQAVISDHEPTAEERMEILEGAVLELSEILYA